MGQSNNAKKKTNINSKLTKESYCPYCGTKIGKESSYSDVI